MTADAGGGRILVAGVGNLLRRDDGFGIAVVEHLLAGWRRPADVDLIEVGIGGMNLVHQLLDGYRALIVVDAVDRGEEPGSVRVIEPEVPDPTEIPFDDWQALFTSVHLTEPHRVFLLARLLGVLPERVWLVGCQPQDCESLGQSLTPPVRAAVALGADRVRELVERLRDG